MPQDDPQRRRPDTTRAETELDWKPRWQARQGIREMTLYYYDKVEAGLV
jgi:UDP-glucuronate decarboxylase